MQLVDVALEVATPTTVLGSPFLFGEENLPTPVSPQVFSNGFAFLTVYFPISTNCLMFLAAISLQKFI